MRRRPAWKKVNISGKTALCFAVVCLLTAACALSERLEEKANPATVIRQGESTAGESKTLQYIMDDLEDGKKQEITIKVNPVERSEAEAEILLEQAVKEWEQTYLGENDSQDEIRYDLNLNRRYQDGLVDAAYESDNYNLLNGEGEIHNLEVEGEGALVTLTAAFSYREVSRIETRVLCILPPTEDSSVWIIKQVEDEIARAEAESREEEEFQLPESVGGHQIQWLESKEPPAWAMVFLLGIAAVICLEQKKKQDARKRQKEREAKLMREYPLLMEQFALLLGCGMNVRGAWERILQMDERMNVIRRREFRAYVDEMWETRREMSSGMSEKQAYEQFGERIGLMPYRRLSSILVQHLLRGTRDVQQQLQEETKSALEMRRNHARQMGEEAGTKLLFPMMLMFLLILVILLLPATLVL